MMTGQGRELEAGENIGVMGGFVSAKEEVQNKIKTSIKLLNVAKCLLKCTGEVLKA